jgi:hypothetical protein
VIPERGPKNNKSRGLWPSKAKNMIVLSIWDYSAARRDPLGGVLQSGKSPSAVRQIKQKRKDRL